MLYSLVRFLSQSRNSQVQGVDGDCLVIEADTPDALNIAENELFQRIAAISITGSKPMGSYDNMHNDLRHSNNAKKSSGSSALASTTATKNSPKKTKRTTDRPTLMAIKRRVVLVKLLPEIRRHVFVDNSNVFIGAQNRGIVWMMVTMRMIMLMRVLLILMNILSPCRVCCIVATSPDFNRTRKTDYNVRVNARKMATYLRQPAAAATILTATAGSHQSSSSSSSSSVGAVSVVAGSKPPASGAIWSHWEDAGFQVRCALIVLLCLCRSVCARER